MKISKTVYEVYFPYNNTNLIMLDLSICQNDAIVIYQPVIINDNENLDKYDLNSDYYKDLCYSTTSDYGTDINLKDRTNNFFDNNLTLCAEDCTLIEYNKTTNKSKCSCNIMFSIPFFEDIIINKTKLYDSFKIKNIKNVFNYRIMKCYKKLFIKEGLIKNFGLYIFGGIFVVLFIFFIIFYSKDFKNLNDIILVYTKINWDKIKEKFPKRKRNGNALSINGDLINNNRSIMNNINRKVKHNRINKNKKGNKNYNKKKNNYVLSNLVKYPENNKNNLIEDIKNNNKKKNNNKNNRKNILNPEQNQNKKNESTSQILKINNKSKKLVNINEQEEIIRIDNKNKKARKKLNTKKENIKNQSFQFSGQNIEETGFEFYKNIISPRDIEINNLEYKSALKTDKRTYIQYYISLLRTKHILLFSFFYNGDYNAQAIKKFLFFFIIIINFTGNTLFFNDSTMHKIYLDQGKFNFIYQIPKILLSSLITGIITTISKMTALSEEKIILLKNEKDLKILEDKKMEMYKIFGIKYVIFFIASFILFFIFGYYVSIFCVVYAFNKRFCYQLQCIFIISFRNIFIAWNI